MLYKAPLLNFFLRLFFVFLVASAQAGGADTLSKSILTGVTYAGLQYVFWNWGRPQGNPAATVALAFCGHYNAWQTMANLVGQAVGAFTGAGIQWGFLKVDGGFIPPVTTPTMTVGLLFGWEIWGSFILISGIVWGMSDRIFGEALDVENNMEKKMKKRDSGFAPETAGTSRDIPVGLQKDIYGHMAAKVALAGGVLYFATGLVSYLYVGAPVGNFWFWISHMLAPAIASPPTGTMTLGIQFCLYAFGSIVGGLGAFVINSGWLMWSRTFTFMADDAKCEETGLWFWALY